MMKEFTVFGTGLTQNPGILWAEVSEEQCTQD